MSFSVSHKTYLLTIAAFVICSSALVFDFDVSDRRARYNPNDVTHYDLRYDIFPPSSRLFKIAFLEPIEKFSSRDTAVLIGNSVIAGVGAKDKLYFNSTLSDKINVINAGLSGEHLGASSALAILGININAKKHPSATFHIFVAYPPSRLYEGDYWVTGPALTSLAKEHNISDYVTPDNTTWNNKLKQPLLSIKGWVGEHMRCIIDGNASIRSIVSNGYYCETPYNTENSNPIFLTKYAERNKISSPNEQKLLASLMSSNTFIDNPSQRSSKAEVISDKLSLIERFLADKRIPHKIHFILLRDAPDAVETLPMERQQAYDSGREIFLDLLAKNNPNWNVLDGPSLASSDFFDMGHLRESGQTKLAGFVSELIVRNQETND